MTPVERLIATARAEIGYLEKALQSGFGDYNRIAIDRYSSVSLLPVRHLTPYSELLQRYHSLFGK